MQPFPSLAWFELTFWLLLGLIFYTYAGYPLCLGVLRYFVRKQAQPDESGLPSVSMILAAHNEVRHIRGKLENCLALDYPRDLVQILVGSDGSDDGTNEIVSSYRDRGVKLFPFSPRRGKMATVNRLVRKATGEICVFSDISERFDSDALKRLTRHFADPTIGAVTGNHVYNVDSSSLGAGTRFYWRFRRLLQVVESQLYSVCSCDGTIYACRRALFPFPPDNTINDDVAVPLGILRQGRRVIFEPQAIARGDVLRDTSRFFHQKIRGQAGKYQNFAEFPDMFRPWPPLRFWIFLSHSVMPVLVPWMLLTVFMMSMVLSFQGSLVYQLIFGVQAAMYLAALGGAVAQRLRWVVPLVPIPYYFVVANLGSMVGFFAFLRGSQSAAWRKVE